jgi:hypothetical protein
MKTSVARWNVSTANVDETRPGKAGNRFLSTIGRLRSLLNFLAPIGYQDDEGFHYGEPENPSRHDKQSGS